LPTDASLEELVETLRRDQRRRWANGTPLRVELYLEAYPLLADNPAFFFELICNEYLLREEFHDHPSLDEYAELFPAFANQLRRQVGLRHIRSSAAEGGAAASPARGAVSPDLPEVAEGLSASQALPLLLADQRERWRAGHPVGVETYLERYAALRCRDSLLTLIFHEYQLPSSARAFRRHDENGRPQ
jgi:hypothetical protein